MTKDTNTTPQAWMPSSKRRRVPHFGQLIKLLILDKEYWVWWIEGYPFRLTTSHLKSAKSLRKFCLGLHPSMIMQWPEDLTALEWKTIRDKAMANTRTERINL
jgi:hypothetical protein